MSLYKRILRVKGGVLRALGVEPPPLSDNARNGEFALLRHLRGLDLQGDCVVDVGAAVGLWTAEAMKSLRASEFICIEPLHANAEKLRERFNGHASVHRLALSDRAYAGRIFDVGGGGRMHLRDKPHRKSFRKSVAPETVEFVRGDDLLPGRSPCFIKIDCDGHDAHVLRGLAGTLQRAQPVVQFEYCDMWLLAGERLTRTLRLLHSTGYDAYRLWPDRLEPVRFGALAETYSFQNFVALPRGRFPAGTIRFNDS